MIYYVRMRTRARPLRRFRFAARSPRGSRQVTLSPVPDPLCVKVAWRGCGAACELVKAEGRKPGFKLEGLQEGQAPMIEYR